MQGKSRIFTAYSAASKVIVQIDGIPNVEAVPARMGDVVYAGNQHDTCSMTVVNHEGRLGLLAKSHMSLPGMPEVKGEQFIPAE